MPDQKKSPPRSNSRSSSGRSNSGGGRSNSGGGGAPGKNDRYPKIQAYLSKIGVVSRRKAEDLIREKKIQVNGVLAKIGQRIKAGEDIIVVDGKKITTKTPPKPVYILLYKPKGYVSTTSDEQGRQTVLDLVSNQEDRLYPVGRLDIDSEGLMILTNDGNFTFKMTHPTQGIAKTYHVLIAGSPTNKALNHLRRGVKLKEGYIQPDEMGIVKHEDGNTWLEIVIHEGKNRIVRRMMKRIGYKVMRLVRITMGPFDLRMLAGKRFIKLDKAEVAKLFREWDGGKP
jgi:23S rRNA pseudouridine2605 synthase